MREGKKTRKSNERKQNKNTSLLRRMRMDGRGEERREGTYAPEPEVEEPLEDPEEPEHAPPVHPAPQ